MGIIYDFIANITNIELYDIYVDKVNDLDISILTNVILEFT